MGGNSNSDQFSAIKSSDIDLNSEECGNPTNLEAYPLGVLLGKTDVNVDEGESRLEPYVGLEFNSADDAHKFYSLYAMRIGFKIRTGQLYRSRVDGSVSNRRFVCSKEGFQLNSRTGCSAFIRVTRRDSGKWVLDQIQKDHNHELENTRGKNDDVLQGIASIAAKPVFTISRRPKRKLLKVVVNRQSLPSAVMNAKRLKTDGGEGQSKVEPYVGLDFISPDEAYQFYLKYASNVGFRIRIGQLFRSKVDGSITSRRFVCSMEGFQHPARLGCGAFMRIKRQDSGRWIVDRHQSNHNHDVHSQTEAYTGNYTSVKKLSEEVNKGFENNQVKKSKRCQENYVGSDWYSALLNYFQTRQAEDTGFFHAVEVHDGHCRSVFWADGRSRYACSQFGDAIVFDTSYRKSNFLVPFSTFIGVNHHKQPVLLGCALIADDNNESFTWLFQTWLRAMSGRHPLSIIADQDKVIQQAIAQVFPRTHHRFSMWQIRAKECEYFSSMDNEFKYEYEKCIYHSQTVDEFDSTWNALVKKYFLQNNTWLKDMYDKREKWVPLYLRSTFFAGIPVNGSIESYFGELLNAQTPLKEFFSRYEKLVHQRREEERQEDFNSSNLQALLQSKEPIEEQCRRFYTLTVFKAFQMELVQSFNFVGCKIYEEGTISRYLVRKCDDSNEKYAVTFSTSNLKASCGCQMFEFEGILCRHILRVHQMLDIRELPSHYILHRWTKNAEYGFLRNAESMGSSQELKALMLWSLRDTACKYIEAGAESLETYKFAYEIMREGGRKLCWQR